MNEGDSATYGEKIADEYDEWPGDAGPPPDADRAALFLAGLAAGRPALELGIGTGRVGLPLAALGVEVHGVESSARMLDRLHRKCAEHDLPLHTHQQSFGDLNLGERRFGLVFAVFNTLFCLVTQEEQIACLRSVAEHLEPGGLLVLQCLNPAHLPTGNHVGAVELDDVSVHLDVSKHNPVAQTVTAQHIVITEAGIRFFPYTLRYSHPAELDLMATMAGFELRQRHADFDGGQFTANSRYHVSVYARANDG
ncbi:class I SAM-dependent methyltransferase [Allokutzneria sp. A3M-2-11 16]|uniref:class I SAM-dependent DNA methyltransferase n=1 Tax=Allokutzneria sp. A3M-2-11 16 TaxID=2962043 RepID=UPI0020B7E0CC|nr:class I SAM-dependent methyltransferase [Allokutzneria sp. A3M-2-11 16]MCP3801914.1 class I SAM-dependent methyltransferase [Allokutzneria sp. A3M-2-11 16]